MNRKSSRRDFLRGHSTARAVADAIEAVLPDAGPKAETSRVDAESYQLRVMRRAMACPFEVCLNAGQYANGTEAAMAALDLVDALEEQLSFFRETSELSRINRTAASGPVEVEPGLFGLLELAMRVYKETDGTYDLTATPLWQVWGFARRAGAVPDEAELAEARQYVGSHLVELGAEQKTVRFLKPGVRLNLGSIGKGYALDCCAARLEAAGIGDFLLHGGQSSVLARGTQAAIGGCEGGVPVWVGTGEGSCEGDSPIFVERELGQSPERKLGQSPERKLGQSPRGWSVGVRHPLRPDRRIAEIWLCDQALATSGSWAQSFLHGGRRLGHILDPRTGRPAEGVLQATVVAPTAALADALSTAFYVLGPEKSLAYCRERPEIGAVLVCPVRHSGGIEIHTAGVTRLNPVDPDQPIGVEWGPDRAD